MSPGTFVACSDAEGWLTLPESCAVTPVPLGA